MRDDVKQKWLKALRSGDYKQCRNRMFRSTETETTYCCLGVLVAVATNGEGCYSQLLPLGVDIEQQKILMGMNDIEKKSFNEIADYIEENL